MIITEPEFIAMSRIMMSKWSESKLRCRIIVMSVGFKLMIIIVRLVLLVVMIVVFTLTKLRLMIQVMLLLHRPMKLLILVRLLIRIIVMFPLIFMCWSSVLLELLAWIEWPL